MTTELKPELRFEGLKAMGIFGVNGYAEEAASVILEVVKGHDLYSGNSEDQKVTTAAKAVIRRIGPATLPVLIRALKDRKAKYARRFAVNSLHHSDGNSLHRSTAVTPLWPEMKAAVPALIESVSGDDAPLRRLAITALSTIDPDDERVVAALINATKDKDRNVCIQAVNVLGSVRRHRNRTIPVLIEAMKNKDANVRQTAIRALDNITRDPKVLLPPLIEALKSEYQDDWQNTRHSACRLLGKLGPKARETMPALLAVFWMSKPHVRIEICSALGKIGTEDTAAFEFLAKVFNTQTEQPDVHRAAGAAMLQIQHGKQFKARNESEDLDPFGDDDQ